MDTLTIRRELREANISFIRGALGINESHPAFQVSVVKLADETIDDIAGALLRDARRPRRFGTAERIEAFFANGSAADE